MSGLFCERAFLFCEREILKPKAADRGTVDRFFGFGYRLSEYNKSFGQTT